MEMNINIDPELIKQFRRTCEKTGYKIDDVISRLLEEWVKKMKKMIGKNQITIPEWIKKNL